MFRALRTRISQGKQYIRDVRIAQPLGFRGLPHIDPKPCKSGCAECVGACPTRAISLDPVRIDLGLCVFCDECTRVCPAQKLSFTNEPKMATSSRQALNISATSPRPHAEISAEIKKIFGRSLKLRSVSAGGCNACELEINALSNVNFDIGRFGIDFVASPRHADALVLSGPITKNMVAALELAYQGMPDPKFVIAVGTCAISGGLYQGADGVDARFLEKFTPSLYIPGCPPHPLTFVNGVLELLGRG
ncbi:4Fe-4S dicluster domain-containing protein [Bdellovibrionota bacterium FG-1]